MQAQRVAIMVLATMALTLSVFGQSKRVPPTGELKRANSRPATPTPSPTPSPESSIPSDAVTTDDVIKVDTRLVTLPVRVIDRKGRFIGGLAKENFSVLDNNSEQTIEHFQNESQPFTVALMLDMSYSTVFKIDEIQAAAIAFIDQLRPEDRIMVVSFDGEFHLQCEPTADRKEIYAAIRRTKISTGTSLYEAVGLVMNTYLRNIEGRKAIVLFSDGVDTTSRRTYDRDNYDDALELDALIYPIRYDTFADVQAMKNKPIINSPDPRNTTTGPTIPVKREGGLPFPLPGPMIMTPSDKGTTPEEYAHAERYLDQLAERTGGRTFLASTLGNLNNAFKTIASELREFYSIGYYPTEEGKPGTTRSIKVKTDQPNVAVKTRNKYLVPELATPKQ